MRSSSVILSSLSMIASAATAYAAPPNYADHILPIFEQSCTNCHNPDKQKGDLDLSTYTALMRGGSGGKIAEPGEGGASKLYGVITHTLKPKMPPKGEKLSKKDADTIRAWVDAGLLENKTGKPKKKKKAAFSLQVSGGTAKPDGPPPLPQHILLEPVVKTSRASVVADMAVSPWAPLLAVTGQRQVLLYHTQTLQLIGILPFPAGQPETLNFHPSGKYLLAGGGIGGKSGTTITWEVKTGKVVLTAGKDFDSCIAAALRSDLGGVSFGGPTKRVKLWDTAADEQLISIKKHTDWVTNLRYSPDGVLLASGGRGGGVYVWEAETGNPFHTLRAHQGSISDLAWRTDSNLLASASEDGSVIIWEMNNGKQVKKFTAHGGGVLSLAWNKNGGSHLVTSGRDHKVKIWKPNFTQLKELPRFPSLVTEVELSQDGKRVFAADWTGKITVWDVKTAKQIATLAANPPSIQARIQWLEKEIAAQPEKLAAEQKEHQAAQQGLAVAKAAKEKTEKVRAGSKAKLDQLQAQRTRLDGQLKVIYAAGKVLSEKRKPLEAARQQARDALNRFNDDKNIAAKQKKQAETELNKQSQQAKQLAARAQKTQEAAAKKPEDPALQQAAAEAKQAHEKQLAQVTHHQKQLEAKTTALAQLTNQQKTPGNKLAAAGKAMEAWSAQWKAHQAKRAPLQAQRNALNKPIEETRKLFQKHEKNLKPSRDKLAKAEAHFKAKQAALQSQQRSVNHLKKQRAHWQAATINTQAIHLRVEAGKLLDEQETAMDAFTELAAEIAEIKDPAALKVKFDQLQKLRQQIDQAAPATIAKTQQAAQKKAEYLQKLKPQPNQ